MYLRFFRTPRTSGCRQVGVVEAVILRSVQPIKLANDPGDLTPFNDEPMEDPPDPLGRFRIDRVPRSLVWRCARVALVHSRG